MKSEKIKPGITGRSTGMNKISALILAAGEGKRMKSKKSKLIHKLCGKAMIEWVFAAIKGSGIDEVAIITGQKSEQVRECMGARASAYIMQEKQLGTGHAVMQAEEYYKGYDGHLVVLCGDTPLIEKSTLNAAIDFHISGGFSATVITAEFVDPTGYGRVIRANGGNVSRIVEHRDASPEERSVKEINSGMYIFSSIELFNALKEINNKNDQGEYYLTDTLGVMATKGLKVGAWKMGDPCQVLGVNDRVQLSHAAGILRKRITNAHMLSGVTIIDPDSTYIDAGIEIGMDTVIYPGTILEGNTVIGEDCEIGPDTRVVRSRIGNAVKINKSVVLESEIGESTQIGPFSYIRPDCKISSNAKIGDFVEVKNSTIGSRTKIPHLAYIGDSDVGGNTNIACGVITVNYDGKRKSRTKIGSNSFVGCNVNLVAPVTVGDDSYIAAGSTITEAVPENALSIARSRQENKAGWVIRKDMKRK